MARPARQGCVTERPRAQPVAFPTLRGDRERAEGAVLPERDGYIAGVPCWIDTSQPDPDAAARFYGGLFGWDFEDAMPAGAPGRDPMARPRGGGVAAGAAAPGRGAP